MPQTNAVGEHSTQGGVGNSTEGTGLPHGLKQPSLLMNKKPKGRPRTPDATTSDRADSDNLPLYAAITLLQRLIRGRATQNAMFEGRYRRTELIAELRAANDYEKTVRENPEESQFLAENKWSENITAIKETTIASVAGAVSSNLLVLLAAEKEREEVFLDLQEEANKAVLERKQRELIEAGRRQKEGIPNLEEVPNPKSSKPPAPSNEKTDPTTE